MGPITLFDKSFLQTLSTDESVWFDHFFYSVISPLFYIETLADLEKSPRNGKTAEQEVSIIAAKTPQMSSAPCYFHHTLCIQDLLGNHVPMTGQIPMAGGRQVVKNGKLGTIIDEAEEAKAFMRWQEGRFLEVERRHARAWRAHLARIDLSAIEKTMKRFGINAKTCKTVGSARKMAGDVVAELTRSTGRFNAVLEVLEVPQQLRLPIKERWKHLNKPPLPLFAPYAAHVLLVEIFFRIALGANRIASTRASHRIDIAYLFYLPFCNLFVSTDRLHRLCAPLFLRPDQTFVWGNDLKPELASLNDYYTALSEEVKRQGIYKFARHLPEESQGVIRELYQRYTPNLLKPDAENHLNNMQPGSHQKILHDVKAWESAPEIPPGSLDQELETLIIKRTISRQKGSWLQIGPEVE